MRPEHSIDLPDEFVDLFTDAPGGPVTAAGLARFERAVNRALDDAGWPRGLRGAIAVPAQYWFVNIWNKDGSLKGHVGPITSHPLAQQVAQSWRQAGCSALHTRRGLGKALTNDLST